ncbi:MAG: hypothetical protein IT431_11555 [Phycisphaerales bacterium]|nr:hypothetical protein [Phycisphaerales bacterium]
MSTDQTIIPNPEPDPIPPHVRRRWDVFIKVFRDTGSVAAACAAASPHLDKPKDAGHGPGYRTFLDWMRKFPSLAEEFEQAKFHALGLVEKAIAERSMTPERVPVFSRGVLVGERIVWRDANALLLRRAARLDPNAWAPKQQSDVRIEHTNAPEPFSVALTPEDVLLLPPERRMLFIEMLSEIRNHKEKQRELIDSEPTTRPALLSGGGNEATRQASGGGDDAPRQDRSKDGDAGGD